MEPASQLPELAVDIGRFTRFQLPSILRIERASFDEPWGEKEFIAALKTPHAELLVAHAHQVRGFILIESSRNEVEIWNLAVEPEFRRRGVGRQLVACAKAKLAGTGRRLVRADVRETNLAGQLFFRDVGFCVRRHACGGVADPSFTFEYTSGVDGHDVLRSILQGDGRVVR